MRHGHDRYHAWLWGELLLLTLLGASLVLFASRPAIPTAYELPELRIVLSTAIMLAGGMVALLAGARFAVEGRRLDLLLACGFFVSAGETLVFSIAPALNGGGPATREAWADAGGQVLAAALVAAAPLTAGRVRSRQKALRAALATCAVALVGLWLLADRLAGVLPDVSGPVAGDVPLLLTLSYSLEGLLCLIALVGFGMRFRSGGEELHRWLALGATFLLFSTLQLVFAPLVPSTAVSQGDFLRLLAYLVLLAGVWRAIRAAEFGRAVAEERARVAREIHDGLAQYLFAISTQATMLENGAAGEKVVPRLKAAATAAQLEARFAVLALSTASGGAPFDAALRRYVELLTADGELEVDLEIDPATPLGPDEQIEVFRIVQEGLANARKHAGARRAEVHIGRRGRQRFVTVTDDGSGFDGAEPAAGQGLKNMRVRAASIGGTFAIDSAPGAGTALEVVLRY